MFVRNVVYIHRLLWMLELGFYHKETLGKTMFYFVFVDVHHDACLDFCFVCLDLL